jgi:hypothetical protein
MIPGVSLGGVADGVLRESGLSQSLLDGYAVEQISEVHQVQFAQVGDSGNGAEGFKAARDSTTKAGAPNLPLLDKRGTGVGAGQPEGFLKPPQIPMQATTSSQHKTVDEDSDSADETIDSWHSSFSFVDLDSGLRDCEIPFEQLQTKSPFCRASIYNHGRRCERYSISQFPEVVRVQIRSLADPVTCSGTVIAKNWVLSAAHCFIPNEQPASSVPKQGVTGAEIATETISLVQIYAANSKILSEVGKRRNAQSIIVPSAYTGKVANPAFQNDIALIRLDRPYPSRAMQPASLARPGQVNSYITIAGYGYSNAGDGSVGKFGLTWPPTVRAKDNELYFTPTVRTRVRGWFCRGDSGGPVFAGRIRGCKAVDIQPEARPRILQGSISYGFLDRAHLTSNDAQTTFADCRKSERLVMQNITYQALRSWICMVTNDEVGGCP